MDPVLTVLEETKLERRHIEQVCTLFGDVESRDIFTAFDLLCRLDKYLRETKSWAFNLLAQYDFSGGANQFELDLATMVGGRAQKIIDAMARWPLDALKRKVRRLPAMSDWGMVLTSIVLRISTAAQQVEFNARLALSRATLVRIHCELSLLMVDSFDDYQLGGPLVEKYRSFVAELLRELEEAPTPVEQEKMFRTVSDLKHMFTSFKGSRGQTDPPQQHAQNPQPHSRPHSRGHSRPQSRSTSGTSTFAGTSTVPPATSAAAATASPASGSNVSAGSSAETIPSREPSPDVTIDTSIDSDDLGNSTMGSSVGSMSDSIMTKSELLSSSVMGAFNAARTEQDFNRSRGHLTAGGHGLHAPTRTKSQSRRVPSPVRKPDASLNVQMVDGRMKVQQNGAFVDMQEWLDAANGVSIAKVPLPTKPIPQRPEGFATFGATAGKSNIASSGFLNAMRTGRW